MTEAGRGRGPRRDRISVWAPAKINLALEVLGRRPDGYHQLITIFQALSFGDTVEIELRDEPGVVLTTRPARIELGPPEENLVVRAARVFLAEWEALPSGNGTDRRARSRGGSPRSPGVGIRLKKRIPVGAGLGGGSSDAAATLLGLSRLLRSDGGPIPPLPPLALGLGADVPFFLEGGTRLATGVGERLRRLPPWPRRPVVLVFPNVGVSTSSVFRDLETGLTLPGPLARMAGLEIPPSFWETDWSSLRNDLQPVVMAKHPLVRELLEEFRRMGSGFARMSGSGSAVFGVAETETEAREWVESFRVRGYWARTVHPARTGCRLRGNGGG